jgi:hypothetical protein
MTVVIENPEAIAEIEELMARFGLSAEVVVERLIIKAGTWMPMETLAYPPRRLGEPETLPPPDPLQ